jgi:hypothetical protein
LIIKSSNHNKNLNANAGKQIMSQNLSLIIKDNSMNNLFPVDEGVSSQNKKDYSPSINQKRREKLILSRNVVNKD